MHEMGIMSAMLRSIDQILEAEENVSHVEKIVMQIGEISGVVLNISKIATRQLLTELLMKTQFWKLK